MFPRLEGHFSIDEINFTSWQSHHVGVNACLIWEICTGIPEQMNGGKIHFKTSSNPTRRICLESMENQSSPSGIFWQDPQHYSFYERCKKNWTLINKVQKKSKTGSSLCPYSATSIWEKKKKFQWTFLDFRLTETANIHSWELPMRWIGDSCERKVHDVRFIWVLIFLKQTCSFAQPFLQIISVSTGAIVDWCDELVQQILGHSFSSVEKSGAKLNEQFYRKLVSEKVISLVRTRDTNVQRVRDPLCIHQERFLKFVNRLASWEKFLLDNTYEPSTTWMEFHVENMVTQRVFVTSWSPK